MTSRQRSLARMASRVAMALLFLLAGITHFVRPGLYVRIVPPWVPFPMLAVYISGIAGILRGAGVLVPATARLSCWGVAVP